MRNSETEEKMIEQRRERMLNEGFRIFAERGIQAVSMQEVAAACGLGIATLYRYFNTKLAFVIAIGTKKWEEYFREINADYARRGGELMTAAEDLDFYLGSYILLYREHPDILRFNQNFNNYLAHTDAAPEQLQDYLRVIETYREAFERLYKKGIQDGTIRTDEPIQVMFNATMHIMLAVCARYAQGLVYHTGDPEDLTRELMILKRMILNHYVKQPFSFPGA